MAPNNFNEVQSTRGGVGNNFTTKPKGRNTGAVASTSGGTPTRQNGNSAKPPKQIGEEKAIRKFLSYVKNGKNENTHTYELLHGSGNSFKNFLNKYKSPNARYNNAFFSDFISFLKTNAPINYKVETLLAATTNNRNKFITLIENITGETDPAIGIKLIGVLVELGRLITRRKLRNTQITPSTFLTHVLKNKLKKYNTPKNKEKLETVYKTIKKNKNLQHKVSGEEFVINFKADQESKFFKYMLADIIHDSTKQYDQSEMKQIRNGIKNILFDTKKYNQNSPNIQNISTIFGKGERVTLVKGNNSGKYSNSVVDNTVSETLIEKIKTDSIQIKSSVNIGTIHRNGKNLVRYKIGNERYYKQFNVILNSNQDTVFKRFIESLLLKSNNRKIGSFLICPAQLINAGVHKTPVSPKSAVMLKLSGYNIKNIYDLNSKRMNVLLKFPDGKTCRLQLLFNVSLKKYYVRINQ